MIIYFFLQPTAFDPRRSVLFIPSSPPSIALKTSRIMKHLNKMEDPSADQTNVLLSAAPSSLSPSLPSVSSLNLFFLRKL